MCCRLGKRRTARVRKGLGTKEERGNSNPEAERIDYGLGTELGHEICRKWAFLVNHIAQSNPPISTSDEFFVHDSIYPLCWSDDPDHSTCASDLA